MCIKQLSKNDRPENGALLVICGFYIPFGNVPKYQKKMTPWKMATSRWEVGNEQGASCGRQQSSVQRLMGSYQKDRRGSWKRLHIPNMEQF